MRKCNVCKENKAIDDFYKDKSRVDGHADTCKICSKLRASQWAKKNKERVNERQKNWQKEHAHRVYEYNLKSDYGMQYGEYDKLYNYQQGK